MPSSDDVLSAEVALQQLNETESMIDFRTNRLVDLREPRLQFSDSMLQEYIIADIRSQEGKLLKEFWMQLCTKRKVPTEEVTSTFYNYPSLKKWLTVVGVSDNLKEKLTNDDGISVESLLKMSSSDLQDILEEYGGNKEDRRKLPDAITQLKKCQDSGGKSDEQMYWDSWNKDTKIPFNEENSPNIPSVDYNENLHPASTNTQKESTSTCNSEMHALSPPSPLYSSRSSLSSGGPPSPTRHKMYGVSASNGVPLTPPITSDNTSLHFQHAFQSQLAEFTNSRSQASTPQPSRNTKIQTNQRKPLNSVSNNLMLPSFSPLRPSKSTEWSFGLHTAPLGCPESLAASNQSLSSINTLPPPTSSNSKLFSSHKKHKKRPENLDLTRDANDVNFIDLIRPNPTGGRRKSFTISPESSSSMGVSSSPLSPRTPVTPGTPHNTDMWVKQQSISSSIPSYPQTPKTPKGIRGLIKGAFSKIGRRAKMRRNKSEEIVAGSRDVTKKARSQTDPAISVYGNKMNRGHLSSVSSDRNYSSTQSTTSINSITHSTIDLQSSRNDLHPKPVIPCHDNLENEDMKFSAVTGNSTPADNRSCNSSLTGEATGTGEAGSSTGDEHSMEEMDPEEEALIARQNLMRQGSTMSTMQEEWDIPYESLQFEELIGCGRVGKVWRGKWHGEVAIRVIEIGHNDEEKLRAFKHEVMLMKKTRHENIELFMGSCMKPPHLAIVTGFCKGRSLYQHIRQNKDHTVNINNAKIIAQHIAQGMGYLHSRRIIHKDLKSKNIFLDGNRVVITDFGLMGLHTIASKSIISIKPYTLQIPDGWLCYMAPEIIRCLHVPEHGDVIASLPYSKESDVYAFGTVWFELLTGCWPFQDCPAETIIWQVGHGKKQSLGQLQAPKELKEILMRCWSYDASTRPDFSDNGVMGLLLKLPIAKIIRRLSQPTGGRRGRGGHDRFLDLPSLQASQFGSLHDLAE